MLKHNKLKRSIGGPTGLKSIAGSLKYKITLQSVRLWRWD